MTIKNWQIGTGVAIGSWFDIYIIHRGKKTSEAQLIIWKDGSWFDYMTDRWNGEPACCGMFGWAFSLTILKVNLYISRYA